MCGIAGYIGPRIHDHAVIEDTLRLMQNRGPDRQASFAHRCGGQSVRLLHSRLSIIDLSSHADQPISLDGCTLVFNGEIYNYRELRAELEREGEHFATDSDTEVLLRSYIRYGEACVDRFEGMWSFAIFDARKDVLFLSRDRFGEKPLYVMHADNGIYFASETRFLRSLIGRPLTVNRRQLLRYLVNGYKSLGKSTETYYADVEELPYATNMSVGRDLSVRRSRYWRPAYMPKEMTRAEAVEGTMHHLCESVRLRLRADVPLAFCLSGGVDSAALASIAAKRFSYDVATFTIIDEDERYNEYANAKATIDDIGCRHTFVSLSRENTLERLEGLVRYHDAPLATISYYVHSFLSERIAEAGFRVAFSGTGADELFTGYYDHFLLHLHEMRGHPRYDELLKDWQKHTLGFIRNPVLRDPELYGKDPSFRRHVYDSNDEFRSYLRQDFDEAFSEERFCGTMLRNRMLNELFHEAVPVILREDDLNSMKYSVENRSPYLDTGLFSFAYSIPEEHLIVDGYAKSVLRDAVAGVLNDTVRLDRRKKGFNASITSIVDFSDPRVREYLLDASPVFEIFDRTKIEALFDMHPVPNSHSKFLFNFINAKVFLEMNERSAGGLG